MKTYLLVFSGLGVLIAILGFLKSNFTGDMMVLVGFGMIFIAIVLRLIFSGVSFGVSKLSQPTQDKALSPLRFLDKYRIVILVVSILFLAVMLLGVNIFYK